MLSYVNKLHTLIVNLGRKGRESLNKMKFYFVHCTKNHNFILLAMYNLKHFRFLLVFSKMARLHLQATQAPTHPSSSLEE